MRYLHVFRAKKSYEGQSDEGQSDEEQSDEEQREREKDWGKRFRKLILDVKKQNPDIFEPLNFDCILAVSYTHLPLPTKRIV